MLFKHLLFLSYIINIFCYMNINIGATGLYLPYTLGALGYIKKYGNINNYHLTGISGGSFASVMYYLEDDLSDHDKIWKILIGNDNNYNIIFGKNIDKFLNLIKNNLLHKYKYIPTNTIKKAPISVIISKINNKIITNEKISDFDNLEDLLNYCICSSYIPYISGNTLVKKYKDINYIDGCIFTNYANFEYNDNSLYIHRTMWKRNFNLFNYFYLNKKISKKLFDYGWNDTKNNLLYNTKLT